MMALYIFVGGTVDDLKVASYAPQEQMFLLYARLTGYKERHIMLGANVGSFMTYIGWEHS